MDLQQLYSIGAFVSAKPVKRTFTVKRPATVPFEEWADPKVPEFTGEMEEGTLDVWLKRMSSADEIAIANATQEDQTFVVVHRLVRNEDGSPLFQDLEQVKMLAPWLLLPLVGAIEEVAARNPKANSGMTTPSGSKSPDGSADVPRKNGKKQSPQSGETS